MTGALLWLSTLWPRFKTWVAAIVVEAAIRKADDLAGVLSSRVLSLEAHVADLERRRDRLEERTAVLEGRAGELEHERDDMVRRADRLEDQAGELERRAGELEARPYWRGTGQSRPG